MAPAGTPGMYQFTLKKLLLAMLLICVTIGVLSWAVRENQPKVFVILAVAAPMGTLVVIGIVRTVIVWIKEERGPPR